MVSIPVRTVGRPGGTGQHWLETTYVSIAYIVAFVYSLYSGPGVAT